ncbi:MAG: LLM class flavin-dependent oxidoreductase [Chloroflexi bacterium]|nr:LLM class flavin-dependent oxidoreductase [Chloroflexota bacterium]
MDVHWFLPTTGDGRSVLDFFPDPARKPEDSRSRSPDIGYLRQIASAADRLGFAGVLTPTGIQCEDAWLVCAALAADTERLRFLVAFRPGFILPTLAAQMTATLQRITRGRTLINIVTGGDPAEQRSYGDFLDHDARYERTDEFLEVFRRCWDPKPFAFEGKHYHVEGAGLRKPTRDALSPAEDPGMVRPAIYFGGASAPAEQVAAKHVDHYLLWGEPPAWVAERVTKMRALAAGQGRVLRFGIRLHVIARVREEDAWAEAERLLSTMSQEHIEIAQRRFSRQESVGQQRMVALHNGKLDMKALAVAPNLWSGIGLVRGGAGTALVGSYDQVAERIREYAALGLDTFILSGYPHLEEAYTVGEEIIPRVRDIRVAAR